MAQEVVQLTTEQLTVGENVRFGLKKYRVDSLAQSILELGGVQTPLKVEPTEKKGVYLIREGHYRLAAVGKLNKDQGAGLTLPCIVEQPSGNGVDRIRHQISENQDRENLSPMDMAVSIQKLRTAGLSRPEICGLFKRPGGRKGIQMEPISFELYHKYLNFLEFPKKIQTAIHEGTLSVGGAITLLSKPKAQWEEIVAEAEADRLKELEADDKRQTKFMEEERKVAEAEAKVNEAKAGLEAREKERQQWEAEAEKRREAAAALYKQAGTLKADKAKAEEAKEAEKAFRAAEAEAKVAETKANDAKKEAEKIQLKLDNNSKLAAERAKKLEAARKDAEKKSVKKANVERASSKVAGGNGYIKLTGTQMRDTVKGWCLPGSFPKVQRMAQAVQRCFDGETTDAQCYSELAWLTGERKEKPKFLGKGQDKEPLPLSEKQLKEL